MSCHLIGVSILLFPILLYWVLTKNIDREIREGKHKPKILTLRGNKGNRRIKRRK